MSILQEFVQNGCVVIDLSEELEDFHDNFIEKTKIVPLIQGSTMDDSYPELSTIFNHPKVVTALKLLLGENYIQHHMRNTFSGRVDANRWPHRDFPTYYSAHSTVNNPSHIIPWSREHYCRVIQLLYSPNANPETRSGTGLIPGSQYWDDWITAEWVSQPDQTLVWSKVRDRVGLDFDSDRIRLKKGGQVVLMHGDMWHYAYPQEDWDDRLLIKTSFLRVNDPVETEIPDKVFNWKKNIVPTSVSEYHWNWYHAKKLSIENSLTYRNLERPDFKRHTWKERVSKIYQLAGIIDCSPMISELFNSEDRYYAPILCTALSLNENCKEEVISAIEQNSLWRNVASSIFIISNMGVGDEFLMNKWNEWLQKYEGYSCLNLIRGAPIVCQGNSETLNLIVNILNSPGLLKRKLIVYETINSLMQLSKSCGIVPDVESILEDYRKNTDYYISSNAYQAKKFLYN